MWETSDQPLGMYVMCVPFCFPHSKCCCPDGDIVNTVGNFRISKSAVDPRGNSSSQLQCYATPSGKNEYWRDCINRNNLMNVKYKPSLENYNTELRYTGWAVCDAAKWIESFKFTELPLHSCSTVVSFVYGHKYDSKEIFVHFLFSCYRWNKLKNEFPPSLTFILFHFGKLL